MNFTLKNETAERHEKRCRAIGRVRLANDFLADDEKWS